MPDRQGGASRRRAARSPGPPAALAALALIAASLLAAPEASVAQGAPAPSTLVPAPAPAPAPSSPPAPAPPRGTRSSGSGFAVTAEGHVLTNNHVVRACTDVQLQSARGERWAGRVLARDERNDLALLKVDAALQPAAFRRGAIRSGESIVALGYPLRGLLAADVNVSVGIVSAMAGLRNDATRLQISAPVQPGNSGGPLLDGQGAVAGVVVAKLDALSVAKAVGDLPQNVNFAVKGEVAQAFLRGNGVEPRMAPETAPRLEVADSVQAARAFTLMVECDAARQARLDAERQAQGGAAAPGEAGAPAESRAEIERRELARREAAARDAQAALTVRFALPIACRPGADCVALSFFDHGGGKDYACGFRASANQRNTRFVLAGDAMSRSDVAVLAAAAGTVVLRNEQGVAIDHGGGWRTTYVFDTRTARVQPGERVAAGETLGYVGRIGTSSVPVLAFGVLRNDTAVDPFRPDGTGACGDVTGTRWQPEALVALRYQPAGVVASGFAAEPVDLKKAIAGGYAQEPGRDAPVLGFWVMSYGVRAGDREVLAIVGPDGRTLAEGTLPAERNSVDRAVRVQRPRGDTPWAPGTYRGTYRLVRDGQVVTEHARVLEVR